MRQVIQSYSSNTSGGSNIFNVHAKYAKVDDFRFRRLVEKEIAGALVNIELEIYLQCFVGADLLLGQKCKIKCIV